MQHCFDVISNRRHVFISRNSRLRVWEIHRCDSLLNFLHCVLNWCEDELSQNFIFSRRIIRVIRTGGSVWVARESKEVLRIVHLFVFFLKWTEWLSKLSVNGGLCVCAERTRTKARLGCYYLVFYWLGHSMADPECGRKRERTEGNSVAEMALEWAKFMFVGRRVKQKQTSRQWTSDTLLSQELGSRGRNNQSVSESSLMNWRNWRKWRRRNDHKMPQSTEISWSTPWWVLKIN